MSNVIITTNKKEEYHEENFTMLCPCYVAVLC